MLIASSKSRSPRETSHHSSFMSKTARLLVTLVSFIYLVDEFFYLFLV